MKMKLGLTFSTLSVLFEVHATTVSSIFYSDVEKSTTKVLCSVQGQTTFGQIMKKLR